ncbi:DUF930 domain-containing protein [Hyphomicrobium sp.]|uniref:DUF930 domain-containing protein n=1 Tax=Hyphomicrobium sp. TaxID=82 RepID=UPI002FE286E9
MRTAWAAIFSVFLMLDAGHMAEAGSLERALLKLSPEERAHQACVVRGLEAVRRGDKRLREADRLMPDTFKRAEFDGSVVSAKGAAVRARDHWYALSFVCTVSDDQMKALAFTYKVGAEVPRENWDDLGLWR